MGNLEEETADEWLERMFEFEYCSMCGGDTKDHEAIPFLGNWFAYCLNGES